MNEKKIIEYYDSRNEKPKTALFLKEGKEIAREEYTEKGVLLSRTGNIEDGNYFQMFPNTNKPEWELIFSANVINGEIKQYYKTSLSF